MAKKQTLTDAKRQAQRYKLLYEANAREVTRLSVLVREQADKIKEMERNKNMDAKGRLVDAMARQMEATAHVIDEFRGNF